MAEGRVQSSMIVEGQPIDNFVSGNEPLAVQPTDLQAAPQTLGRGVVPAVSFAAH
jgi:hypothetical protein